MDGLAVKRLRPQGHPVLDKLTWRVKTPSRLLPRLPYPRTPVLETGVVWHSDGSTEAYEEYRVPMDFYDWLDTRAHDLGRGAWWQRAIYRTITPLTCFLQDLRLGVYDDLSHLDWEETSGPN